jgi:hypothetical protein
MQESLISSTCTYKRSSIKRSIYFFCAMNHLSRLHVTEWQKSEPLLVVKPRCRINMLRPLKAWCVIRLKQIRNYNYPNSAHYHRPFFYLKYNYSETGFCFCLQVKSIQLEPTCRDSLSSSDLYGLVLRQRLDLCIGPNRVGSTRRGRHNAVSETLF